MAGLLVERRTESFASRYPRDESMRRVAQALEGFVAKGMVYESSWREEDGVTKLDVAFAPAKRTRRFLNATSIVMSLLIAATIYERSVAMLVVTAGAMLVFPFVVVGYGSQRESEEATLRRRIRKAIVEEPPD